jgi:hypothetical protein
MKEKQTIENIMRNIVEATRSQSLFKPFDNLKNNQPKRLPIIPVAMKKAKSSKRPLIRNHVIIASFIYYREASIR